MLIFKLVLLAEKKKQKKKLVAFLEFVMKEQLNKNFDLKKRGASLIVWAFLGIIGSPYPRIMIRGLFIIIHRYSSFIFSFFFVAKNPTLFR